MGPVSYEMPGNSDLFVHQHFIRPETLEGEGTMGGRDPPTNRGLTSSFTPGRYQKRKVPVRRVHEPWTGVCRSTG